MKFTWTVKDAAEAAKYKIYYYVADEGTLYNGTNDKANDSWSQLRMYSYGTRYDWTYEGNTYTKRFTHIDQGPWAKDGHVYNTMLGDYPKKHALDPGEGNTTTTGIGTVTSMNPLLVGRSIKWDDPTTFANGEKVVKTADLNAGELDFGEIDGKSLCVFFMFRNTETGDNYYGPDKQTNSTDAGKRHFSYSILPWNGCWMSVNLCVPMPIRVFWSSTEDGEYTEVACGTDVEFPGDDVWVKLELNTDFALGEEPVSASYDIWYNLSSLLPIRRNAVGDGEYYNDSYIVSKIYDGPIHLERNTVLRYSIWDGDTEKFGQMHTSGFATMGEVSGFNETAAYDLLNDKIGLTYPEYTIFPIYNDLRKHYMWGNTFVKQSTPTIDLSFSGGIPYSSWTEYLTGKFGLGSGTYTYQTYVPERDLLIPSSLEGILDFFVILFGKSEEITGQEKGDSEYGWDGDEESRSSAYMSRINWIPAGMPVIVRYRNYSAANSMETPEQAATNMAALKRQLTGENLGTENEILPAYFMNKDIVENNSDFARDFYANEFKGSFKNIGQSDLTEDIYLDEPYYDADRNETIYLKYPQKKDGEGNLLYKKYTKSDAEGYQLLDDNGNPLYEVMTANNEKLYFYVASHYIGFENLYGETYQITDEDGNRLWQLADENGNICNYVQNSDDKFLYHYKDGSGNKVYLKYDGTTRIYQEVDGEGKRLFHKLNEAGNKLYYEYYTEEGSTEKHHLFLLNDEDGNQEYQIVNSNGKRLYYFNDENGDFLFQKTDADGTPLYYEFYSDGVKWVYALYPNQPENSPTKMPETALNQYVVRWWYVESTTESAEPVLAKDGDPSVVCTTTVPNAYPLIDESKESGVLAYTTEQYDENSVARPYAVTTTQGEWPVTITTSDAECVEYANNNTLYPVETTTETDYPVLQRTTKNDYPFVGTADSAPFDGYTIDVNDAYVSPQWSGVPEDYASIYHDSGIAVTITDDDPSFKTYLENGRIAVYATDDVSMNYPPYCGRYDNDNDLIDYGPQGEQPNTDYPVLITESSMEALRTAGLLEGYKVEPAVFDSEAYSYNDESRNKGVALNTIEYEYPDCDYDAGPVQRKWATRGFIDINDFEDNKVADYATAMEPQTFKVYDGTTDRAFWFADAHCYHLSSLDHLDEGNFHNALCSVSEPTAVVDLEEGEDGKKYAVFGLGIDHTNEWVGANIERSSGDQHGTWTNGELRVDWFESVIGRLLKGGVERNDDIGLQLTAFTNKYSALLTDSARQTPVLDDWLVYAGDVERGGNWYHSGDPDDHSSVGFKGFDHKPYPFYYGFFLRDHTIRSVNDEYSNYGYDYRSSLASAAWRRVSPFGNPIQPGKVFLLYDEDVASFSVWYDAGGRNLSKLGIIGGTALSPTMSEPWSNFNTTGIKEHGTSDVKTNGAVYDLQGRMVMDNGESGMERLPKGVYIKDGKKFVVK